MIKAVGIFLLFFLYKEVICIKAITIKQPFASLIAEGIKEYEFRMWKTNYRGEIYIHAGKGIDKEAMKKYRHYNLEYPSGCIIAKANLTDCIKIDDNFRKILKNKKSDIYDNVVNKNSNQNYAFKLENIEKIKPIKAKGKLSFWKYEWKEGEENE